VDALCYNVTTIVDDWKNNGIEVGGIFVDYLQLLHARTGRTMPRTEEVKYICDRLNDMAKATALPVVCAVQFNRDATKNDTLDAVELANIGESAGIENIAEDVYLVWQIDKINTDRKEYTQGSGTAQHFGLQRYQYRSRRCFEDEGNPQTLRKGYLYVENLKARDYATGGYCLLPFHGAAGAITSDISEHDKDDKQNSIA
jgi:replicative DNA helicase